jgi:hypothetical protein
MNVRFLNNFIIEVTQTDVDDNGDIVVVKKRVHVKRGDIYKLHSYERYGTMLTLEFEKPDGHFGDYLHGVARGVESDYCEIMEKRAPTINLNHGGCGGCGHKQ